MQVEGYLHGLDVHSHMSLTLDFVLHNTLSKAVYIIHTCHPEEAETSENGNISIV
jgi:hypothetical protein